MNEQNRKTILNHIDKIEQYAKTDPWLMEELRRRFGGVSDTRIDEIYEYCIERVIREQAEQFYKDFPIKEIAPSLVDDFCRMERNKRDNNFEDFCLAAFQQVENITNWFCKNPNFINLYNNKKNGNSCFTDDYGASIPIIQCLIKYELEKRKEWPLLKLYFNERIRAILYFVYFKEKPYKYNFDLKYKELNELYQCRNLNHRGGEREQYQETIIAYILPHKYQYYLKFTGLLVDFVDKISEYMSTKEEYGILTKLPGANLVKLNNGETFFIEGKISNKIKDYEDGVSIVVTRNTISKEILNIIKA